MGSRVSSRGAILIGCYLVTLVVACASLYIPFNGTLSWLKDFGAYRDIGLGARHGASLYDLRVTPYKLPFVYPPLAAVIFEPLSMVPLQVIQVIWLAANITLLYVILWRALSVAGLTEFAALVSLASLGTLAFVWMGPTHWTLRAGNINLMLLALIYFDMTGVPESRFRGIALGFAASFKLTPGVFMLYLLLTRRYRAFGAALTTLAATIALGFLLLPGESRRFWGGTFLKVDRFKVTDIVDNLNGHSLRSVIMRILHGTAGLTVPWLIACAVVCAIGIPAAVAAYRLGDDHLGILVTAGVGLLISPVSWENHWVWVVPLCAILVVRTAYRKKVWPWIGTGAAITALALRPWKWAIPQNRPMNLHPIELIWASWLAGVTFVLIVAAASYVYLLSKRQPLEPGNAYADRKS